MWFFTTKYQSRLCHILIEFCNGTKSNLCKKLDNWTDLNIWFPDNWFFKTGVENQYQALA